MMDHSPVFYDPSKRRWKWFKRSLVLLIVLGFVMVCAMTVSILTAPALASGNMLLPEDVSGVNPQIAHPGGTLANANLPQQLLRAVGTLNSYRPTPTQISTPLPTLVPANPHPTETANPNPTPPAPGGNPTATPLPPAPTQPSAPTATPHGKKPTPPAPTPGPTSINPTPTATINPHKRGLAPAMNGQPASMIASPLPPFLQAVQAFFSQLLHLGQSGLPPASRQPSPTTDPLVIGFYVNGDDNADTSLQQNIQNLDRLMPVWLHLADANGTVADDNLAKENDVLDLIRQLRPNLPVVPLVNSYNPQTGQWNSQVLGQMLNNPAARDQTIQYLLQFVQNNHLAGISIDFEDAPLDSQKGLQAFMQSLYARFHPLNLEVTQVIPLANPSFDLQVYSQTADYLVLVGYDEHWSTAKPGPVASQGWLKTGLDHQLSVVDPGKVVLAIGNYGYDWADAASAGQPITIQDALQTASEAKATLTFDPQAQNPTFLYADKNGKKHTVWYLDAITAFNQVAEGMSRKVHGFALWRLGSEDPSVWKVLRHPLAINQQTATALQTLDFGYGIAYRGQGEVLKITGVPAAGSRTITFDPASGRITAEVMVTYPSAYTIMRWGRTDKKIALTFDDGPDPDYTPRVLEVLRQYKVPGTFFIIGVNGSQHPDILRQINDAGYEIGVHTYTHPDISTIPPEQLKLELNATQLLLESQLGKQTILFRPPYGIDAEPHSPQEVRPLLITSDMGYYTIGMQIDPSDWRKPGVQTIVDSTLSQVASTGGNIILLHDGGGDRSQTVEALPAIIQALQAKGYQFVSVSDLMGLTPAQVMPPVQRLDRIRRGFGLVGFSFVGFTSNLVSVLFVVSTILGIFRMFSINILAVIQWLRSDDKRYKASYTPRVSVLVPAYNEAKVINKTIQSLLQSTYPNMEIVVIDDGSKDDTYATVRGAFLNEPRLRVFRKENGGKADALNFGLQQAEGEIIVILDADTIILPGAVADLVRHMSDSRVSAVAGNAKVGNRVNALTEMQALEYITSQNMDRRAFSLLNCIIVVPGAIGAWRKDLVMEIGGFKTDTLAEDADLTLNLLRKGGHIEYEDRAIALTEAPENLKSFLKQRFRWMFGMLQTTWKQRDTWLRPKYGSMGLVAMPNILFFSILLPLFAPLMDITFAWSIITWAVYRFQHPADLHFDYLVPLLEFYAFYLIADFLTTMLAFIMEPKEDWRLVWWMPIQRVFYRQLIYYTSIRTLIAAIRGQAVGWNKLERKASVKL